MNDRELEQQLRGLAVPRPRAEQVEIAFDRALRVFEAHQFFDLTHRKSRFVRSAWSAVGLAAAIALVAYVWPGTFDVVTPPQGVSLSGFPSDEDWRRIIRETRSLFPGQVKAVVTSGRELKLELYPESRRISDQSILVQLTLPGGAMVELVSFSGQTIETNVGGWPVNFELLLNASQEVLVAGDNFLCIPGDGHCPDELSIQARPLENGS